MSKEKSDLFVVILFSLIWLVRPILYDEMLSWHSSYLQENVMVLNNSFISTENYELEFLESKTKEIILAKDTNKSFFAEGFSPPLPQRPGSRTTTRIGASNPGSGVR